MMMGGGCSSGDSTAVLADTALPDPASLGIDHVVVVMMENRSFDHYLGWVPGADGVQAGQVFHDSQGRPHESFDLGAQGDYQGCGYGDPAHGYGAGRVHFNDGAMDGFLRTETSLPILAAADFDLFPVGYYTESDLPFYSGAVRNYTVCDRFFSSFLGSTFPNRIYMHAGQTDRLTNTLPFAQQAPSALSTIWDRCRDGGISHRYYWQDLPVTGLWGVKHLDISRPLAQFYLDASIGRLSQVTYIDPFFGAILGYPLGLSTDDHPHADIRDGQAFLNSIYNALRTGPHWDKTLMVVVYDEWGGFFDHVPPPLAPVSDDEAALGNDGRLGIRIPAALLGPRVRPGHVSHIQFDFNSVLNFITWRFGLEPIGIRSQTSINLAHALDFDSPPRTDAPDFGVTPGAIGRICPEVITQGILPLPDTLAGLVETIANLPANVLEATTASQLQHRRELQEVMNVARTAGWKL